MTSDPSPESDRAAELLAAAGLHPSPEELALFTMMYPMLRAKADVVHSLDLGYQP
jgi:hypothetical protein